MIQDDKWNAGIIHCWNEDGVISNESMHVEQNARKEQMGCVRGETDDRTPTMPL